MKAYIPFIIYKIRLPTYDTATYTLQSISLKLNAILKTYGKQILNCVCFDITLKSTGT